MTREQIEAILELPATERVAVAQEIWESVAQEAEAVPLTTMQRDELERRWVELQANPDEGEPWDEVKKALRSE